MASGGASGKRFCRTMVHAGNSTTMKVGDGTREEGILHLSTLHCKMVMPRGASANGMSWYSRKAAGAEAHVIWAAAIRKGSSGVPMGSDRDVDCGTSMLMTGIFPTEGNCMAGD